MRGIVLLVQKKKLSPNFKLLRMREIVDDRIGQKHIQTLLYGLQIVLISRAAPGGGHFFLQLIFWGLAWTLKSQASL